MNTLQRLERVGGSQVRKLCPRPSDAVEFDTIALGDDSRRIETSPGSEMDSDGRVVRFEVPRDVATRKMAEAKLGGNEFNLQQMTETIPVMLWSATADGKINYCNRRILDYIGLSDSEAQGGGWTKLIHPDDVGQMTRTWISCLATGTPYRVEVRAFHASDLSYRWCVASAVPMRDRQGIVSSWHGALMDVHDARQAREEVCNLKTQLAHMARVITMGELAASISHEVCQPLAAIIMNGESGLRRLARSEVDIDKIRQLTERMLADARRACEIVDRIRDMVTHRAPRHTPQSINEIIQDSLDLLRHEFRLKSISVVLDLARGLPNVICDRTQLRQVIVNLGLNAAQAMAQSKAGHRSISIRTALSDPETILCVVEDSGPGIAGPDLPHLFDRFFTTKDSGMGMGLTICRSIIEAHDGQILAESKSAMGGARFTFSLPANREG